MLFAAAPLYALYKDNKNKKKAAKAKKLAEEQAIKDAANGQQNAEKRAAEKAGELEAPIKNSEPRLYPSLDEVKEPEQYDPNQFKNTQDLAEAFTCPITSEIIKEPVTSKYGHLFEKHAIEQWIDKNHKCPMTQKPLERTDLFAQFAVKSAIEQYVKLNDSINKGKVNFNKIEESKDDDDKEV